jgi:glycosyltransferase involved in cell wall biosynthesis
MDNLDPREVKFDPKLPTVLFLLREASGCGFFRCLQPALALRRHHLMNTITDVGTTTPEHIMQSDIVVIQSPGTPKCMEAFQFAKKNGKAVVVEIDDYVHGVSLNNPGSLAWNPGTLFTYRFNQMASAVDAMIVSTPQLAREYVMLNKTVYVLPNYLDEDAWSVNKEKQADGIIRIGWSGGNAHVDDLRMVSPVLSRIVKEYAGKVKLETIGPEKHELKDTFPLEAYVDKCPRCEYSGEVRNLGGVPMEQYPATLAAFGWDITIAPIIDTAFNNAKSDLKLKESAAIGYPTVASDVTPYRECRDLGWTGFLARTHEEWYTSLKELIDSPEKRHEIQEKNKEWIKGFWMDDHAVDYLEVFTQIIQTLKK